MPPQFRLFSSRQTADQRTVYRVVFCAYLLIAAGLLLPRNPLLTSVRPLVLGMPLSLAYIAGVLALSFFVLQALFRWEDRRGVHDREDHLD